jgi:hypothetical protein
MVVHFAAHQTTLTALTCRQPHPLRDTYTHAPYSGYFLHSLKCDYIAYYGHSFLMNLDVRKDDNHLFWAVALDLCPLSFVTEQQSQLQHQAG